MGVPDYNKIVPESAGMTVPKPGSDICTDGFSEKVILLFLNPSSVDIPPKKGSETDLYIA